MKRTRLLARLGFTGAVATIIWLALTENPPAYEFLSFDKINHAVSFLVLALLLDYGTLETQRFERKALSLVLFGLLIELAQSFVGYRYFEIGDLLADASGVASYYWIRKKLRLVLDPRCARILG